MPFPNQQQNTPSYYAVQEADKALEAQIEQKLYDALGPIYNKGNYDQLRMTVLETLEACRNFLYKYLPAEHEIMTELKEVIDEIRQYKQPRELIIDSFFDMRAKILPTLGDLGFRSSQTPIKEWSKLVERSQIQRSQALTDIFTKKKGKSPSSVNL